MGARTSPAHVLFAEDDDRLAALLLEYFGAEGFELSRVATGEAAVTSILEARPDLVLLDLMLPGLDGLEVCRRVRPDFTGAIVMLTASQSEADHIAGLEVGADDFVTKPIEPRVLLARIRAQLRRLAAFRGAAPTPQDTLHIGAMTVDIAARGVSVEGRPVALTTMEFDVLCMLAKDAGSVVRRDDIYTAVLGTEYDGIDRGLDVHVSRIRRKLQSCGFDTRQLKSVRGVGYLLACR